MGVKIGKELWSILEKKKFKFVQTINDVWQISSQRKIL